MTTLVNLDASGAIIPLAPGNPVTVGAGADSQTYAWSTLWTMTPAQLLPLNIFQVADPVQTPANNQVSCGVVYEHTGNTVIATTLYQTITPPIQTPISLYDYAAIAHNNVLMKGITVNVAASGQPPVNILCDGSSSTRADLGLLALFGQVNPTGTKTWVDNNNISTIITGLQCISLATQIGEWIDNTYVILGQILASISATYTGTTEQIDKIVWPTS